MLLLLNVGVLGYLFMSRNDAGPGPGHGPHMGPDRIIIERIGLDEKQQEQFRSLKDEHHSQIMELQHADAKLHQQLFQLLKQQPIDTAAKNAIMSQLQNNDGIKEEVTFEHFRKLRAILKPEQQPKLDELVAELAGRVMGGDHRRPPPGH